MELTSRPRSIKFGLIAFIIAVIGALWAIDLLLARVDREESRVQARQYYDTGKRLLEANHALAAVDQLRKAHAMDRSDTRYALQLASALIQAGKPDEAQTILADILERTPNDGEANLLEGRLAARHGRLADAAANYHRAIYGAWGENGNARTIQARLELANLLAANGSEKELLAELLPLETETQHDLAARKQVARLFLAAGSPSRAEGGYRALIRDDPKDKSNYEGLGQADLDLGRYGAAATAFRSAGATAQADLADEMAGLDPTLRLLSSAEKFRRSVRILQLARDALARCQEDTQSQGLLDDADKELKAKVRRNITNELAEERLLLAEQLWQQRKSNCAASGSTDEALARLMQKLRAS